MNTKTSRFFFSNRDGDSNFCSLLLLFLLVAVCFVVVNPICDRRMRDYLNRNDNQLINCAVYLIIFLSLSLFLLSWQHFCVLFCHVYCNGMSSGCFVCDKLINNVLFISCFFLSFSFSWAMGIQPLQLRAHFLWNSFELQRDMTNEQSLFCR